MGDREIMQIRIAVGRAYGKVSVPAPFRSANAGHASIQSAPSETRDCQSGFNLLNAFESGVHGHSGSDHLALHMSEQISRLVILVNREFSRGCIPFGIED